MQLQKVPKLMNTAAKIAMTSDYGRFRLGAIIAKKHQIISFGTNSKKTHPLQKKYSHRPRLSAWRHAEIHAISLSKVEDLLDADIYVCRVLKDGSLGNSKPCSGCLSAIENFGLRGMYYYEDGVHYYKDLK